MIFFCNVFKLVNVINAKLYMLMSAMYPSFVMHISLFCLLQGYQKYQKTKKWKIHVRYQNIIKTLKNQKKKNKKREPIYIQNLEKTKRAKPI